MRLKNISPRPATQRFFGLVNPSIWRVIRSKHFDVVICYGYRGMSFWIAALACWVSGVALVWSADATSTRSREARGWKELIKKFALPRLYRAAAGVLAPSTRSAEFVRSLGVPPRQVFMIPYVVDNGYFASRASLVDRRAARAELGLPDEALIALYVAKLVPWKRPEDLIEATARVPQVRTLIVGEGAERERLEKLALSLGVPDRVSFLGFRNQSELPALYVAADILVLPSEYEAFGLVVNEAFACGLPAIVSDACGCVEDLIIEGKTGYTFPPGDVPRLASILESLVGDRTVLDDLREGARMRIQSWGTVAWVDSMVKSMADVSRGSRRRGA
jgi:glycosyltransferase involved in cell wall biosynthesis